MRKIIILGSSGSIGQTAIRTIKEKNLPFKVMALIAHSSEESIRKDAEYFNCPYLLTKGRSEKEIRDFLSQFDADIALNGVAGSEGLFYSSLLIDLKIDIALANKETVVLGSGFIFNKAKENRVRIIPVDSEHSALYNLINSHQNVSKLIITASGGPFVDRDDLENVTLEEALKHPTWKMGKKITIDSATLANKGLEVIEAGFLFNFSAKDIIVTVHRQSVVHSLIQLKNGSYYAQLSPPDMALPIIDALADKKVDLDSIVRPLDFTSLSLSFEGWNKNKFPMLELAYKALEKKNGYPIAFNIADEVAVNAFIENRISFLDIAKITEETMKRDFSRPVTSYSAALDEIKRAKDTASSLCLKF